MDGQSNTHIGKSFAVGEGKTSSQRSPIETSFDQWIATLFVIFNATNRLLKNYYESKQDKKSFEFPVPVEEIADFCKYEIVQEDLNRYRNKQISLTLGKLNIEEKTICIDNGIEVSYAQKRYAVAHELGHAYLCGELNDNYQLCTEARIPSGKNEFLADIFAAFLVLPPRETFEYVRLYIQSNLKRPIDHEKMMMELSSAVKYPYTRTITAYEYLRLLASYARYHKEDITQLLNSKLEDPQELVREPIAPIELYS